MDGYPTRIKNLHAFENTSMERHGIPYSDFSMITICWQLNHKLGMYSVDRNPKRVKTNCMHLNILVHILIISGCFLGMVLSGWIP